MFRSLKQEGTMWNACMSQKSLYLDFEVFCFIQVLSFLNSICTYLKESISPKTPLFNWWLVLGILYQITLDIIHQCRAPFRLLRQQEPSGDVTCAFLVLYMLGEFVRRSLFGWFERERAPHIYLYPEGFEYIPCTNQLLLFFILSFGNLTNTVLLCPRLAHSPRLWK